MSYTLLLEEFGEVWGLPHTLLYLADLIANEENQ